MGRQRAPARPRWRLLRSAGCGLLALCGTALRALRGLWSLAWVRTAEPLPRDRQGRPEPGQGRWGLLGRDRCMAAAAGVQSLHRCCWGAIMQSLRCCCWGAIAALLLLLLGCNRCTAAGTQSLHHCCWGAIAAWLLLLGCDHCTTAAGVQSLHRCCCWGLLQLRGGGANHHQHTLAQGAVWLSLGTRGQRCGLSAAQGRCEPCPPPGAAAVLQELLGRRLPGHRGGKASVGQSEGLASPRDTAEPGDTAGWGTGRGSPARLGARGHLGSAAPGPASPHCPCWLPARHSPAA